MRSSDNVNILDNALILLKRKKLIAGITAACVIIAAIAGFVFPSIYRAETRILAPQKNASSMASYLLSQTNNPLLANTGLGAVKPPNDVYTAMLKSRVVLDRIVDRFNLLSAYKKEYREDARRVLLKALKIQDDRRSGIIAIGVEDRDAGKSAAMTNAFVEELIKLTQSLALTEASQRRLFFENQIKSTRETLRKSEEDLKGFQEKTGAIKIEEQAKAMIEAVAKMRAQIAAKEIQLKVMKTYATSQNPDVQKIEEEIRGMREQLSGLDAKNSSGAVSFVPAGRMPEVGAEHIRKVREYKFNEKLFELLIAQYETARLDEARDSAVIQVIDPAIAPEKRVRPKRIIMIVLSAITGFLFAVFAAFFMEYRDKLAADSDNREKIAKLKQYAAFRPGE